MWERRRANFVDEIIFFFFHGLPQVWRAGGVTLPRLVLKWLKRWRWTVHTQSTQVPAKTIRRTANSTPRQVLVFVPAHPARPGTTLRPPLLAFIVDLATHTTTPGGTTGMKACAQSSRFVLGGPYSFQREWRTWRVHQPREQDKA